MQQSSEDKIRDEFLKSYKRFKALRYVERFLPLTMYYHPTPQNPEGQEMRFRRYKNDKERRAEIARWELKRLQKRFEGEYLNLAFYRIYKRESSERLFLI